VIRKTRIKALIASAATLLAIAVGAIVTLEVMPEPSPLTKVAFHLDEDFGSSLVKVAQAQDIFAKHGVEAVITEFPDGASALMAMMQSPDTELAMASSSGFSFEAYTPLNKSIKIISQLANNEDNYYWLVREGKGDGTVRGLKGLKLGYPEVSGYRAFLEFSLKDHGIDKSEVTLVPMEAGSFASAMADGTIDAHPSRILLTEKTLAAVKGKATELHDVGAYNWFNVLSTRTNTLASHEVVLSKVLSALLEAQEFSYTNSDIARQIIGKSLKVDASRVPKNITDTLSIRLSNGLLGQLKKNRALLAEISSLPISSYFDKPQDVIDSRPLEAVFPLVVHLG
jgi:ABC-type nitrate/sulfonate/bicarbonate transport system substrate-binding protein